MGKRTITPHQAKEWLANNNVSNYRPLHLATAQQYARDMARGAWNDTGDPIAFDVNNQLQNGQHRLMAVTIADVDVRLTVQTNQPVELRDFYDIHKKRTLGNILGQRGIKNGNFVAAAKRLEIDITTMRQGRGALGRYTSEAEIIESITGDDQIIWVVENVINKNVIPRKLLSPTVAIVAYAELHKIDPYACAQFFALFIEPENMSKDHPIMALHRKFTQGSWQGRGRVLRLQQITVIYRAWNAWRLGQDRDHFKANVTNDEGKLIVPTPTTESLLGDA